MTDTSPTQATIKVTLELTEDAARRILVTALQEAARASTDNALRAGDSSDPDVEWAESQERQARTAWALAQTVEAQLRAKSAGPEGQK
jgi:hypothetical protein